MTAAAHPDTTVEVFISYAHEDEDFRRELETHLSLLRRQGVLSMWHDRQIGAGADWAGEVDVHLTTAGLILLLISPDFLASDYCYDREMQQALRRHAAGQARVIPIIIRPTDWHGAPFGKLQALPRDGKPVVSWPNRDEAFLDVTLGIRAALNQLRPEPRSRKTEPSSHTPASASELAGPRGDQFAISVQQHMAALHRHVERLTQDQYRIIRQLQGMRRVRISGCAGSGKTLVAAEKAIRLANAGLTTLFLCHNPLLARHVTGLTHGSGVQVEAFGEWIASLAGANSGATDTPWTPFEEPTPDQLGRAFDVVVEAGPMYDAIIVDEGQDFRSEWWTVVEAALTDPRFGILYIFHDDFQALLPYRSAYPIREPVLDLSRNCRNSGRVYETMRLIYPSAPLPEEGLRELGDVLVRTYWPIAEAPVIEDTVRWLYQAGGEEPFAVLLGGSATFETSPFADRTIYTSPGLNWQDEVRQKFSWADDARGVTPPPGGAEEVSARLQHLSNEPIPTTADIELVRRVARAFRIDRDVRRLVTSRSPTRSKLMRLTWTVREGRLELGRKGPAPLFASEFIMHFEREDWASGIPAPEGLRFRRHDQLGPDEAIPVYQVSEFKGLEADCVLLYVAGPALQLEHELFVGISRARLLLALVIEERRWERFRRRAERRSFWAGPNRDQHGSEDAPASHDVTKLG